MGLTFSIIIPVLNEARRINGTIAHVGRLGKEFKKEIIVVDGDQNGATLKAVSAVEVIKITAAKGRGTQLNAGAGVAGGDILVFLHVDTSLPPGAFDQIAAVCNNPKIAGGAFDLEIDSPKAAFGLIAKVASLRSRLTRLPYGDQAQFVKRTVFEQMGGFADIPIMEDVALMRSLKKAGYSIKIIADPVITSPRRWQKEGILKATFRNWILVSLYFCGVPPEDLARYYKSSF